MPSLQLRRLILLVSSFSLAFVVLASIYSLTLANPARPANTIVVNLGDSIQAAIDAADPGDTIVINAGTYTESLTLNKAVSLTGVNSATVVIMAPASQRVLAVSGVAINNSVVLSGFTVAKGNVTGGTTCPAYCGGGILITNTAQPLIQNMIIRDNSAGLYGGGIYAYDGSLLTLINVHVFSNAILSGIYDGGGGGVFAYSGVTASGGRFENNVSHDPYGNGGGLSTYGMATIAGTEFVSNTGPYGGGLYAYNAIINGVRFERNYAFNGGGGGLFVYQTLQSTNTTFISNVTKSGGGGALVYGQARIASARFENNRSINSIGGGLDASDAQSIILIDTQFISNVADFSGGGAYTCNATVMRGAFINNSSLGGQYGPGHGGGLYDNCHLNMTGTRFISNTASDSGGGVRAGAATINGGQFINNSSGNGGGLYVSAYDTLGITGTEFISNFAGNSGGAFYRYNYGNNVGRIVNAVFADNTAGSNGAAMYLEACASFEILQSTIAGKTVNAQSAIYIPWSCVSLGVTNTIIASHTVGIEQKASTVVYEDYNLFYGNTTNVSGTASGGTHDVFGDPNFADPVLDNYHIISPSAAIDAGVDAGVYTDLDGNVRPSGSGFDIGAHEAVNTTTPITGLVAVNDSPTRLGDETILVAFVQAGDQVSYQWDFGDGSAPDHNQPVAHTYPAVGIYTAIVTASNSVSVVTATTRVTVDVPLSGLTATNNSPTIFGSVTTLTATIGAGSNVTYIWDFGDGAPAVLDQVVMHTYPFSITSRFTATVTAMNSINAQSASTTVIIIPKRIYLPLVIR